MWKLVCFGVTLLAIRLSNSSDPELVFSIAALGSAIVVAATLYRDLTRRRVRAPGALNPDGIADAALRELQGRNEEDLAVHEEYRSTPARGTSSPRQSPSEATSRLSDTAGNQPLEREPEDRSGTDDSILRNFGDIADKEPAPSQYVSPGASTSSDTAEQRPPRK